MGRTPPGETRERILRFVRDRLARGEPPTVREVQRQFGFRAVQTAREHLEALVRDGRLAKEPGRARGYRLVERGEPTALVPLLGRVPAGPLDAAIEDPDGWIAARVRRGSDGLFALRVHGDSMVGAGILPGDVVVVRRQPRAEPGDLVVARVGDEATVKRLRVRGRRVELHAENPAYAPIVPDPAETAVLGKVVEVHRFLE